MTLVPLRGLRPLMALVAAAGLLALSAGGTGASEPGPADDCCAPRAADPSGAAGHDEEGDCGRAPGCPDHCGHCSLPCCSGVATPNLMPSALPVPVPGSAGMYVSAAVLPVPSRLDGRDLERPPRH